MTMWVYMVLLYGGMCEAGQEQQPCKKNITYCTAKT